MSSYRDAGVDINKKMQAIESLRELVTSTHNAAVLAGVGAFGGCYDIVTAEGALERPVLVASTDGVGTKTIVALAVGKLDTVGADLVNHCVNDILCQGATPLLFLDYIAAAKLEQGQIYDIVKGIATACKESGIVLLGGETAEMPGVYQEGAFDLVGTIVGIVERERIITGKAVEPGDVLLALPSSGLHTNGYSLARKLLEPEGYAATPEVLGGRTIGEALLEVHRSYANEIKTLRASGIEIRGLAHITGGGIWDNLPRSLAPHTGAVVRRGSWEIPPIFDLLIERGEIEEREAFHVFNMGLGMIAIIPEANCDAATALAPGSRVVGEVVAWDGEGERVRLV